jgi:hypothetical protein
MKYVDSVNGVWVGIFIGISAYMSLHDMLIDDIIPPQSRFGKILLISESDRNPIRIFSTQSEKGYGPTKCLVAAG